MHSDPRRAQWSRPTRCRRRLQRGVSYDTAALDIQEIARFSAGVTGSANIGSGQLSLRGQNLSGSTFRDGIPGNTNAGEAPDYVDLSTVERVEVIKGPTGTLFGAHTSGGMVNYVSKRPKPKPQTTLYSMTQPNRHLFRLEADDSRPLGGGWAYRAVLAYQEGTTFIGTRNDVRLGQIALTKSTRWANFLVRVSRMKREWLNSGPWFVDVANNVSTFRDYTQPTDEVDGVRHHNSTGLDLRRGHANEARCRHLLGNVRADQPHAVLQFLRNVLMAPIYYFSNTAARRGPRGYAVAVQDNISFWQERLILVAGARYDYAINDTYNKLTRRYTRSDDSRDGVTQAPAALRNRLGGRPDRESWKRHHPPRRHRQTAVAYRDGPARPRRRGGFELSRIRTLDTPAVHRGHVVRWRRLRAHGQASGRHARDLPATKHGYLRRTDWLAPPRAHVAGEYRQRL